MTKPLDALRILEDARPSSLDPPDQQVRDRIYEAALNARPASVRPGWSRRRRYLLSGVGLSTFAVLLVGALALQAFRSVDLKSQATPRPVTPTPTSLIRGDTASAVLLAAARVIEKGTNGPLGAYWYTSTQNFEGATARGPGSTVMLDGWIARSPSAPSWFTGPFPVHGKPQVLQVPSTEPARTRFSVLDSYLTFEQLEQLPTSPAALSRYLLAIPARHPELPLVPAHERLFLACRDLAEAPAALAVRAACFRLLAGLQDLTALGPVRDPLGRSGVGVADSYLGEGDIQVMIIDSTTGAMLTFEDATSAEGHVTLLDYQALVKDEWTNVVPGQAG